MRTKNRLLYCTIAACLVGSSAWAGSYRLADVAVVVDGDAPAMVKLAGDEIRGYVYRLTSVLPPLTDDTPVDKPAIVVRVGPGDRLIKDGPDPLQNFSLYIDNQKQIVHGASDRATLWAAYHLIESWGVGFYLGSDAVPPVNPALIVEYIEHSASPVFKIRGNLPWYNFLNSPTTWNPQDYKTFFDQMAKQKANLIMFHSYDYEPFCAYDITDKGAKMGEPLMTTISPFRHFSPCAMSTSDHLFGTDLFFDRGEWGSEVGIEDGWSYRPGRAFVRQQQMLADALSYAKARGIETCLGFEVIGDPLDTQLQNEMRKRIRHVLKTYPLDYLGIWQYEHGGTKGASGTREADKGPDAEELWGAFSYFRSVKHRAEGVRMTRQIRLAYGVMKEVKPEVQMVVSGWGGDLHQHFTDYYRGLHQVLPEDIIFAALDNIDPTAAPEVSKAYGELPVSRRRWPIPWFESDGGTRSDQTGPQPNVIVFEPLLKDMARKKCQGALGIHWRTRNVQDVAGYLYRFAWNPQLTAEKFLHRYARDLYGPDDADYMARVHTRLEELGPQYVGAKGCHECSTNNFSWFRPIYKRYGKEFRGLKPYLAVQFPEVSRFAELEALSKDLLDRSGKAAGAGRRRAAIQYHDLAMTIRWLVIRTKVGLEIWNETAPLDKKLQEAERLFEQGRLVKARKRANVVLKDLQALDFRIAFQALAVTCRTRGELGMLATANGRYGRVYATFVQRIVRILGRPLPRVRGPEPWKGREVMTVFPVPNHAAVEQAVRFDAVLLPSKPGVKFQIELTDLTGGHKAKISLPLQRMSGACRRAVFFPPGEGVWAWRLAPAGTYHRPPDSIPLSEGVLTVGG
ncbi:MAG: hypothetical protein ACYTA5_23950 [Planctomycetota bacterium]